MNRGLKITGTILLAMSIIYGIYFFFAIFIEEVPYLISSHDPYALISVTEQLSLACAILMIVGMWIDKAVFRIVTIVMFLIDYVGYIILIFYNLIRGYYSFNSRTSLIFLRDNLVLIIFILLIATLKRCGKGTIIATSILMGVVFIVSLILMPMNVNPYFTVFGIFPIILAVLFANIIATQNELLVDYYRNNQYM